MTAGELKALLANVSDDTPIVCGNDNCADNWSWTPTCGYLFDRTQGSMGGYWQGEPEPTVSYFRLLGGD